MKSEKSLYQPTVRRWVYSEEPIEKEGAVDFRLLYAGKLFAGSNSSRHALTKHEIRRVFHPQLKRLWATNFNLREFASDVGMEGETISINGEVVPIPHGTWEHHGIEKIADHRPFNGFRFIPLVAQSACLRCKIDILFLRPEDTDTLISQGGDIDGRIKILFDSQRMPAVGEIRGEVPQGGEDPFFVLLEDDRLITDISVTTGQLLMLPEKPELSPHDVFLEKWDKLSP
jgi:hypothetical protein